MMRIVGGRRGPGGNPALNLATDDRYPRTAPHSDEWGRRQF